MKILDRLRTAAGISNPAPAQPTSKGGRKSAASRITEYQITRLRADLGQWRIALGQAENVYYPDRTELLRLYREAVLDAHLSSVMETRKLNLLSQPFKIVDRAGKEDEKLTRLFQTPWFYKFCLEAMEARFWGPRVVELLPPVDGEFAGLEVIQPEMTIPEFGLIRDTPGSLHGIDYRDGVDAQWILQLGDSRDLGLLHKAIPHVIWKKNAMSAWSEYCERFALPIRTVNMDLQDEDRVEVENMLRNMGRAAYAILPPNTEFTFHQPQTFKAEVFSGLIDYPNRELSKLVLGQTMTTEDGASLSQSEVHERVADKYTLADKTYVRNLIMWELWDKLLLHGYPVAGFEFKWDESENLGKKELFAIVQGIMKDSGYRVPAKYITETFGVDVEDKPEPPAPVVPPGQQPHAGTQPPRAGKARGADVAALYARACTHYAGQHLHPITSARAEDGGELLRLFHGLARQVYQAKGKPLPLDQELTRHYDERLQAAVTLGYESHDMAQAEFLRTNVQLFAAAKTAHETQALSALLLDEQGGLKSWRQFKADALVLHEQYNVRWLQAEYEHAIASAQMAARWQEFEPTDLLKYQTVGDSRVRAEHAAWDGITRPASDDWWLTHYPPNGWLCRCLATIAAPGARLTPDQVLPALPDPDPLFQNNVGVTGIIFPDGHPYFAESPAAPSVPAPPPQKSASVGPEQLAQLRARGIRFVGRSDVLIADTLNQVLPGADLLKLDADLTAAVKKYRVKWRDASWTTNQVREPYVLMEYYAESRKQPLHLIRTISLENGQRVVDHDLLELPKHLQGKDLSRRINSALYEAYRASGVDKIRVHAALQVGGYAWARAGFAAINEVELYELLESAQRAALVPAPVLELYEKQVTRHFRQSPDKPFPIWRWAETEHGKSLLLGSNWHGELDLHNPEQVAIFESYLRRTK